MVAEQIRELLSKQLSTIEGLKIYKEKIQSYVKPYLFIFVGKTQYKQEFNNRYNTVFSVQLTINIHNPTYKKYYDLQEIIMTKLLQVEGINVTNVDFLINIENATDPVLVVYAEFTKLQIINTPAEPLIINLQLEGVDLK